MPQRSKKVKKKGNVKRKLETDAEKVDQGKYVGKGLNIKNFENLSRYFNNEELQELRNVLKNKDLNKVSLVTAAVILNKFELLKKLFAKGCNINEAGPNRTTPLMWAVKCKNNEIVNFLLQHGADTSAKNDNGDNILFIALENRLWDETSFITLWNQIKSTSSIDINFMSKHGRNMLHTTIRREWNDFLNMLILEKVNINATNSNKVTPLMLASYFNNLNMVNTLLQSNADILKEDTGGCTALCYAISYIINKDIPTPHLVIEKLMVALYANGVTFQDYFKKQIDFVLNAPVKQNKSGQPLPDTKACIIPYALRYVEDSLKTLIEVNIFKKIVEAAEDHFDEPLQIIKLLTIITNVIQQCEKFSVRHVGKNLLQSFISDGGVNFCFSVLKRYGSEVIYNYDFMSASFLSIINVCVLHQEGRSWLFRNYSELSPFYSTFLENYTTKEVNENQNQEILTKFSELIEKIKSEDPSSLLTVDISLNNLDSHENALATQPEATPITESIPKEAKQEIKSNAKKTKRRAKALKAKIAKIKSADLTERLNLNGKLLEQKCMSDTSIAKERDKCEKSNTNTNNDNNQTQRWEQYSPWEQVWLVDESTRPLAKTFNGALTLLDNQVAADIVEEVLISDGTSATDPLINKSPAVAKPISLYPDWKNKNLPLPIAYTEETDDLNFTSIFREKSMEICLPQKVGKNSFGNNKSGDIIIYSLEYLSGLLERIIATYQNYWNQENEIENELKNDQGDIDIYNQHGQVNNIKNMIKKLEQEHVERVRTHFERLVAYVKTNVNTNLLKSCKIIDRLENLFINHKIRGKALVIDIPLQIMKSNLYFNNYYNDFYELDQSGYAPISVENTLSRKESNNVDTPDVELNAENASELLRGHPDALYLEEMLALPPKPPPNIEKMKTNKMQTMKNAYHLVPSIIKLLEDDDDDYVDNVDDDADSITHQQEASCNSNKHQKRQTLQETLLSMPSVDDPSKLLEALEKAQNNPECQAPADSTTSRWCAIIRSFQLMKNYHNLLNGDIRVSTKDTEDSHIISSGGNFSPVILGLDVKDRPLAVKRIQKDKSVCKLMKDLLNPLLGLRNTNLLHYFTCSYEENELVLATPLCEYNMGEYVMFMKQTPNMHIRSMDIVKQFLAGLRFLHDRIEPIIHGNLKPSNIFIDLGGVVRIAEFGMHPALYTLTEAPNTSVIWFSRETFTEFKETSSINCSCASDIQVAGMLIHFILTAGKHPYGETMQDILYNIEKSVPQLTTNNVDLQDLISWMLLSEPKERPTINQVSSHVFFWTLDKKWRFILACAGVSPHGTPLNIPLNELHVYINVVAAKENIKGKWISITKKRFSNLQYTKDDQDSVIGFLKFIRSCVQNQVALKINGDYEFRNFILSSFPALPLSLFRILESSQWLNHKVLQPFTIVDSLSA